MWLSCWEHSDVHLAGAVAAQPGGVLGDDALQALRHVAHHGALELARQRQLGDVAA